MNSVPSPENTAESSPVQRRILLVKCARVASEAIDDVPTSGEGPQVDLAKDNATALARFEDVDYDLILVDADPDSLAVAKSIRGAETSGARKRTPMLALIHEDQPGLLSVAIVSGCDDHLSTPLSADALDSALERWSLDAEGRPRLPDVHASMADLIPDFLKRRGEDVDSMRAAFAASDYEAIEKIAHKVKGSGGSFGFPQLSQIGADLELAARSEDRQATESGIEGMAGVVRLYLGAAPVASLTG